MAKQIIYGIGKAILRDFRNPKTIVGFADLQDLAVESTASTDDIVGGNKMFPIASFKKETAINVSATNATFNPEMVEFMDGATKTTGVVVMDGFLEVTIPENGEVTIAETVVEDTVTVQGYTLAEGDTPAAGQFTATGSTVKFATEDAGDLVIIVYQYNSTEKATEYSVNQASLAKPFEFNYLFDIYDEDSQITHKGEIKIYKAKCTNGFSINTQHQTPFAPSFEATAQDARRLDGKLWSLLIDGVEV